MVEFPAAQTHYTFLIGSLEPWHKLGLVGPLILKGLALMGWNRTTAIRDSYLA